MGLIGKHGQPGRQVDPTGSSAFTAPTNMAEISVWKRARYRLEWLAVKALAVGIPLLPRRVVTSCADGLGSLAFFVDRRGRSTALENLRVAFGDRYDQRERRRVARQAFRCFARTVLDQFWTPRVTRETYLDYCEIQMDDESQIEAARETGAIWVTPHYGNFEWTVLVMGLRDYDFTIVAQEFKNSLLTELFTANREAPGHTVIPQRGAMLRLLKNLKAGGHAAFLTDLTIKPSKAATVIRCFGRQTCVTSLHAGLARRTKLPVIPGICLPRKDGTYILRGFKALEFSEDASDSEIVQACWDQFEPFIREQPEPWLWMYKHWRFLPESDPGIEYPEYATRSKAFEKVAARSVS